MINRFLLSLVAVLWRLSAHHRVQAFAPSTLPILPTACFWRHHAVKPSHLPTASTIATRKQLFQTTVQPVNSLWIPFPGRYPRSTTRLTSTSRNDDESSQIIGDELFDARTTVALIGGQSLLVLGAALAALVLGTPSFGLGPGFVLSFSAIKLGVLYTLPLGVLAFLLDIVEDKFPSLQDVTKATNRSVLALLGGSFKPVMALLAAIALGMAAGVGEEMLFRGVLQFELGRRFGSVTAVTVASVIFGALHAVTPMYAFLASLAGIYFGWLYLMSGNLAVPIITHAVYDFGALLYAHWTVSQLSNQERQEILDWTGPMDRKSDE
jgi:uncharacterized protein